MSENQLTVAQKQASFMVPTSYEQIERLAGKFCAAGWLPKSYIQNGKPNQAMAEVAIMHGIEVGLPPIAAIQNIAVINGMPSIWGDAMLALVRNSGWLEDHKEYFEGEGEHLAAVVETTRRGQKTIVRNRFSIAMAKKAGLWGKQGPWQQYPSRMLTLRARSWSLRDAYSDVLKGLQMAEEVQDMIDITPTDAPPRPQRSDYPAKAAPVVHDVQPTEEDERAADRAAQQFAETGMVDAETGEILDETETFPAEESPAVPTFWDRESYFIEIPTFQGKNGPAPHWPNWRKDIETLLAEAPTQDAVFKLSSDNGKNMQRHQIEQAQKHPELTAKFKDRAQALGQEAA